MKRVTTVTLIWLGCGIYAGVGYWLTGHAVSCGADLADFCSAIKMWAGVASLLALLGIPVVLLLWVVRFFHWVTRVEQRPPTVGYTAPPPPEKPTPQYTITGRRIR